MPAAICEWLYIVLYVYKTSGYDSISSWHVLCNKHTVVAWWIHSQQLSRLVQSSRRNQSPSGESLICPSNHLKTHNSRFERWSQVWLSEGNGNCTVKNPTLKDGVDLEDMTNKQPRCRLWSFGSESITCRRTTPFYVADLVHKTKCTYLLEQFSKQEFSLLER